jgi:hypothetical protein
MTPGTSSATSRSSDRSAPISGVSPDCAWITGHPEVIHEEGNEPLAAAPIWLNRM